MCNIVEQRHEAGWLRRIEKEPYLLDIEWWRDQESYKLIKLYCGENQSILEVGCLTAHHLFLLESDRYIDVTGIDFCKGAIDWAIAKRRTRRSSIKLLMGKFPGCMHPVIYSRFDRIVLFDVIEHVDNLKEFFWGVLNCLNNDGEVLILIPKGKEFYDNGHINFFPDVECLRNHLEIYFDIVDIKEVEERKKIFCRVKPKK